MTTIDLDLLSTVTGGASERSTLLLDALDKRYGSQGVVSFDGKPTFKATGTPGVSSARGKFDTNALWGGNVTRSFTGTVDVPNHAVTNLHTKIIGSE
ncbi:MAG TPA: hypothetical protein VLX92_22335 [Kofleriaceae bacterium]|nr:hypothetical protein [Kofleriaceae bacterium]